MAATPIVAVIVGARRGVGFELVKHLSAQSTSTISEIRCCVRDDAGSGTAAPQTSALDEATAADARVRVCRGADATDAASLARHVRVTCAMQ